VRETGFQAVGVGKPPQIHNPHNQVVLARFIRTFGPDALPAGPGGTRYMSGFLVANVNRRIWINIAVGIVAVVVWMVLRFIVHP